MHKRVTDYSPQIPFKANLKLFNYVDEHKYNEHYKVFNLKRNLFPSLFNYLFVY